MRFATAGIASPTQQHERRLMFLEMLYLHSPSSYSSSYSPLMLADGDSRGEFVMGGDPGSVLLACQLDCETQLEYNLTIAVSNGVHTVLTQVL